ncbi:MAG: hypothetical protein HY670_07480 [Chloroflexi bacterium]|nr:hypothetical protein [Chloroflexota bacterium]
MRQTIVITDLTQMPVGNQVCVVGIGERGECLRPVCDGGFLKKYLYINNKISVRPRARIGFDFSPAKIEPPHIEDKKFDPNSIVSYGICSTTEWEYILKSSSYASVKDIYDGFLQDSSWVRPGSQTRSIATLSTATALNIQLSEWEGRLRYNLSFKDSEGIMFDRPVSDLTFRELCYKRVKRDGNPCLTVSTELTDLLKRADRAYIRLGLARPWIQPGSSEAKCYLQVTGIYTLPDYLEGRTFADFLA